MRLHLIQFVVLLTAFAGTLGLRGQEPSSSESHDIVALPQFTPVNDTAGEGVIVADYPFSLPPLDPTFDPPSFEPNAVDVTGLNSQPIPKKTAFESLGFGGRNSGPSYGADWYPTNSRGTTEMSQLRQNLSAGMPVWKRDGDSIIMTIGVRNSLYDTNAVFAESGMLFPEELWNINFGTMFLRKFDNGASGMLTINVGSASDRPFASIDEMTFGFIALLQTPARNERDKWQYMLFYSPVGNFNFPVPGLAYQWNPNETLQMAIGIPFSLKWRPTERWLIELNYLPVLTITAKASYEWAKNRWLYLGYESFQETYLLADRTEADDRFVGFEQRLIGGVRWDVGKRGTLDIHAGYAFDRYFGTGQNQIGGGLEDELDLPSGAFVGANFSLRF